MAAPVRIALIGAGVMGWNHARVVFDDPGAKLHVVVDPELDRAEKLADQFGCSASCSLDDALDSDAAIVAASTDSHLEIASIMLAAGVPALVEKPLADSVAGVRIIVGLAENKGVPLMCGFVERFNAAITSARPLLTDPPLHLVAMRHSPPTPRIRTSVVHDLLIHDVDLAFHLIGHVGIEDVRGVVVTPAGGLAPDIADCAVRFEGGTVGLFSASRVSQRKVRTFNIEMSAALIEIDLLRQDVTVYRHIDHAQIIDGGAGYRAQTIVDIPFIRHAGEPLALQFRHFLRLVDGREDIDVELRTLLAPHEVAEALDRP